MNNQNILLSLLLLGALAFFAYAYQSSRTNIAGAVSQNESVTVSQSDASLGETKVNSEGAVDVSVTPANLDLKGKPWLFQVVLNTHSVELADDLGKQAVLVADGVSYRPESWQGDPPGGHHREGILEFKPIVPLPKSIELNIKGVGGISDRNYSWSLE